MTYNQHSLEERITKLEERLHALGLRTRVAERIAAICGAVLLTFLALAAAAPITVQDAVEAKRFVLNDDSGITRAQLYVEPVRASGPGPAASAVLTLFGSQNGGSTNSISLWASDRLSTVTLAGTGGNMTLQSYSIEPTTQKGSAGAFIALATPADINLALSSGDVSWAGNKGWVVNVPPGIKLGSGSNPSIGSHHWP